MKQIPSYPEYSATKCGKMYRNGNQLKPRKGNHGYLQVDFSINGKRKTLLVHRLVAETYLPQWHPVCQVDHIDSDKLNNSVNNLRCLSARDHNSISPKKDYGSNNYWKQYVWYLFEYNDGKSRRRIYNTKMAIQQQLGLSNREMCDAISRRRVKGWRAIACKLSSKPVVAEAIAAGFFQE